MLALWNIVKTNIDTKYIYSNNKDRMQLKKLIFLDVFKQSCKRVFKKLSLLIVKSLLKDY